MRSEVGVGVEAAHELVAVVLEVALDLEPLPQREAVERLDDLAAEASVNTSSLRNVIWLTIRATASPSCGPSPGAAS